RCSALLLTTEELAERVDDPVVPFAQQRGEDVLADPLAPQVIAAVAARMRGGVEVHPVIVLAAGHVVPAVAQTLTGQQQAAPQAVEVDATSGIDVDLQLLQHVSSSQSSRSSHGQNHTPNNTRNRGVRSSTF